MVTFSDNDEFEPVRRALRGGGIALLPTETVYGLAANAQDGAAINALYSLKGRSFSKPLALCVRSIDTARQLVHWTDTAEELAQHFWPGPLSLVLPAKDRLTFDPRLFGRFDDGGRSLSLRCPDIGWRDQLDVDFLALTSANISGQPDIVDFKSAKAIFGASVIGLNEDASSPRKPSVMGQPSTIISLGHNSPLRCLRWGALGPEDFAPFSLEWAIK